MTSDCLPHQAELPTERESRDVMHEDEPLPGSVRPENEALLIRQDVLVTAPRPEMQRAQRRAILGLMFFLSVVGFIFILVIHSVKHRGGSSSGGGAGAGADADIGSNSKKHRPARSCNGPSHPPRKTRCTRWTRRRSYMPSRRCGRLGHGHRGLRWG